MCPIVIGETVWLQHGLTLEKFYKFIISYKFSGLCVDYSAHIAHAFMMCPGPREERVKDALAKIGK